MSTTVMLYSHDSVGLGHARRNRTLAFALAAALPGVLGDTVRGLLIAGHPDASRDTLPDGWDWLVLPGMTHGDGGYVARALDAHPRQVRALRGSIVDAAIDALPPDLFIVDRHPYGVDRELADVLARLRDAGCRTVLGLRDILDAPHVAAAEWRRLGDPGALAASFDAVWLYGDPFVHDARRTGELPDRLADVAVPTGYLAHGRPPAPGGAGEPRGPYVLTLLGGGSDGRELARLALSASVPDGHEHLIVTGPQLPPAHAVELAARAAAAGRTRVVRTAPNVPELIADAAAVMAMCGYNTATEIMASATPALVVPRCSRRQEQLLRAQALAAAGVLDWVAPGAAIPERLSGWLAEAVTRSTSRDRIDLDGLRCVPRLAAALLAPPVPIESRSLCHAR